MASRLCDDAQAMESEMVETIYKGMPPEGKVYNPGGPTCEETIRNRLKNSGGEGATHVVKTGEGPQRVFHNVCTKKEPNITTAGCRMESVTPR